MNCPRCKNKMTEVSANDIKIDVCESQCGGIWFDWMELKKLDERHEIDAAGFERLLQSQKKSPNLEQRLDCPTCTDTILMRYFFSIKKQVEIDECAQCGGVWLDVGELTAIHNLFDTEEDRKQAAKTFFKDIFDEDLGALKKESQKQLSVARKVKNALKWICPSSYASTKFDK